MADRTSETKSAAPKPQIQTIPFNPNIDILAHQPLPEYDRGEVKAYRAVGKNNTPSRLIAFACTKNLLPRWENASNYAHIAHPNLANLVGAAVTDWPPTDSQKLFMIYENNWGQPLYTDHKRLALGLRSDLLMEQFLPQMVSLLKDFKERGFVHGGIRLENIYGGNNGNLSSFILGDCLTAPPSYLQPSLYEPIERAMAQPIARGMGHFVDDLYSFGVLISIMLRVNDPMAGMSDKEIIVEKIEKGSYAALTGKDRFTGAVLELLRGVLHDDKSQRWTIKEVVSWMEGQRLSPKQALKRKKAPRVFHFEGERYTRPELIAMDLPAHAFHVPQYIEDEKLETWISRSLEDKHCTERYEQAVMSARDAGINDNYKHRLVSRLSVALDPPAPIRYKDLCFLPDGFGYALAEAYTGKKDLTAFAETLDQGLVTYWLNSQSDSTIDYGSVANRFEQSRAYLKNSAVGFGLERCLYLLNHTAPCLSSKLQKYFVCSPEEMVLAFEDLCSKGEIDSLFLDRHSVAFLSVKDSRILDSYLIELNSGEEYKKILANIWAITNIQKRAEMGALPHIAEYAVKLMDPVLERFHDRNLRKKMRGEFEKIKKSGHLGRITALLENPEIIETDRKNFFRAMRDYKRLEAEKNAVTKKLEHKSSIGNTSGRNAAAFMSTILGGLAIIALALIELAGKGGF